METLTPKPKTKKTSSPLPENAVFLAPGLKGWRVSIHQHIWSPPTDVYETEEKYIIRVEIAGMDENDLSVKIDQNRLIISGFRPDFPETRAYHRMEIHFGEFSTEVEFPGPVEIDHVEADYQNGFLRIVLPKAQAKRIPIEG
jgi:HSP20 family protein